MGPADLGLQEMKVEAAKAKRIGKGPGKDRQEEDEERPSSCRERKTDKQVGEKWNPRVATPSDSASPKLLSLGLRSHGEVVFLIRLNSWDIPLGLSHRPALIWDWRWALCPSQI